jgi:16S rRNA (guanine1516-N2)-methyltransferase
LSQSHPALALFADPLCPAERVQQLLATLDIPLESDQHPSTLLLRLTPDRLELCKPHDPELPGTLSVDFTRPAACHRASHPGRELLAQAAKVRKIPSPLVIDATAGLGRDGFLLAAAGFRVWLFERNPIIAALLADGLERARRNAKTAAIAERMQLFAGDALDFLPSLAEKPDVIYLDPMFPERSKTAKVKQELRLLQLLGHANDEPEQLLRAALVIGAKKVVVKRPLKGPLLLGLPPSYALRGKAIRFDVYVGKVKGAPVE